MFFVEEMNNCSFFERTVVETERIRTRKIPATIAELRGISLFHKTFKFCRMVGYAFGAHEATTVGSDEQIVFDANATKVLVLFQKVEVQELGTVFLITPQVDEVWDEVDARLIGYNETFL
jgi:hypothetical protein